MEASLTRQGNRRTSFVLQRRYGTIPGLAEPGSRLRTALTPGARAWPALLALGLVLAGCAGSRPAFEPGFLEATEGPPLTAAAAESLATRIRSDSRAIVSVRGSAELFIQANAEAPPRKLLVSLVGRRPDQARLRGRFGLLATVFDLRATGDSLELYLPREGVKVAGPLAEWRDSPFPGADALVDLLLPPVLPVVASDPARWRRTRLGWEVSYVDSIGSSRCLTYEPGSLHLVRQQIRMPERAGHADVDAVYRRHRESGDLFFPLEVRVGSRSRPERCELRFSTVNLNAALPDALFRLDVPRDAQLVLPAEIEWRLSEETEGGD